MQRKFSRVELGKKTLPVRTQEYPGMNIPQSKLKIFSVSEMELAKSSFPLFGGTTPSTESSSTQQSATTTSGDAGTGGSTGNDTSPSGGDSGQAQEMTPEQIQDLVKQVTELTNATKQLQTENSTYKKKEEDTKRAQMGREEALTADLESAQQTIIKLDNALKTQAVINSINSYKDIEFYDPKFIMRELDPSIFENMEVDLDNGVVTVSGIENDLKRIAKEKSWAVKNNAANGQQQPRVEQRKPPGSGAPPPAPNHNSGKSTRREALIDKFPVIAHGKASRPI